MNIRTYKNGSAIITTSQKPVVPILMAVRLVGLLFWVLVAQAAPTANDIETLLNRGDLAAARTAIEQVIQEKPNSGKAYYMYAQILHAQRQDAQARQALITAEKLSPAMEFAKPESLRQLKTELQILPTASSTAEEQVRKTAEERVRKQEAEKQVMLAEREKFAKQNNIFQWVELEQLVTNPFIFKGKTVGIVTYFEKMEEANVALFGEMNGLIAHDVPEDFFTSRSRVALAITIEGKTQIDNYVGGKLSIPSGKFVAAADCSKVKWCDLVNSQ